MDLKLTAKTALITGGAHGLGAAISTALAREGADLIINYNSSSDRAQKLKESLAETFGVKAASIQGNIGNEAEVIRLFEEAENSVSSIDILVNNAAVAPTARIGEMTEEEWNRTFQTNMTGTFLTSREFVRRCRASGRPGRIVNISSAAAYLGSTSGRTHYDASKGGVISFTISLAREVAKDNITVNAVAPGMIKTEMVEERVNAKPEAYLSRIPLGRIAEPEEVADAVVLLCSERTGYMTGAVLNVSGGLVMG